MQNNFEERGWAKCRPLRGDAKAVVQTVHGRENKSHLHGKESPSPRIRDIGALQLQESRAAIRAGGNQGGDEGSGGGTQLRCGRMEGQFSGYGASGQETEFQFNLETAQEGSNQFCEPMASHEPVSGQNFMPSNGEDVEEIDGDQFADGTGNKKGNSHRGNSFLPQEDRVIVSGWLNISKDAVTGASQTSNAFYARLHRYFLENWDMESRRSQLSIQNRWTAIRKAVSKFQGILSAIQRRNESGKTDHDKIKEAIMSYEQSKPWQFVHCWEILRNEPKWNDFFLECSKPKQGNVKQSPAPPATPTDATDKAPLERPEGRDSVKRRRAAVDESASSVAVEMLHKIHARGQQADEHDAKEKEELVAIERAKFDLQQRAVLAKIEQGDKELQLQREIMETNRFQTEAQIMFTDLNALHPCIRYWTMKKQRDILLREGINPDEVESSSGTQTGHPSGNN